MDTNKKESNKISAQDLIKLKHSLDKSIKYKGLNSREVQNLKRITSNDGVKARKRYEDCKEKLWDIKIKDNSIYLLFVVGLVVSQFNGFIKFIGFGIIIVCAKEYFMRRGQKEGFFEGFQNGFESGINKVLEINDEESEDIKKTSAEMEFDEIIIKDSESNNK